MKKIDFKKLFNRMFSLNRVDLHKKVKSIVDPVSNREDSRNIRSRCTENFRMFIYRDVLGKRR